MDSTANESQHSDNKSNTSVDLQHFPNDQLDSNATSKDSIFASEKKEDARTNDGKKNIKKNTKQGLYHQKNLTIIQEKVVSTTQAPRNE